MYKQLLNHFEFHREITTKSGIIKNLTSFCEYSRMNVFDITPLTFLLNLDDKNCE